MNYLMVFDDETQPGYSLWDYCAMFAGISPPSLVAPGGIYYQFGYSVSRESGEIISGPRHSGSVNVGFVDGHAAGVPLRQDEMAKVLISDP